MIFALKPAPSVRRKFAALAAGALAAAVAVMPKAAAKGMAEGVEMCLSAAIPTLFPMMLSVILATESGLTAALGRLLAPLTRRLFGLSDAAGGVVVMSLVGGFPAGAKAAGQLYESGRLSRAQAQRLCLFCFGAGPAFLLGTVGSMHSGRGTGAVLLVIQVISVVILGVATRLLPAKNQPSGGQPDSSVVQSGFCRGSGAQKLTRSVTQASSAMLSICQYILVFSALRAMLDSSGVTSVVQRLLCRLGAGQEAAEAFVPVLLEVTAGCAFASRVGLPLTAFAVGFGGIAVHLQVLAVSGSIGVDYRLFLAARILQGLLSAAMAQVWLTLMPAGAAAAVSAQAYHPAVSGSVGGSLLLLVMSLVWLLCLPQVRSAAD